MRPAAALLVAMLGACAASNSAKRLPAPVLDGPVAMRSTPDAPFRSAAPSASTLGDHALPPIKSHALKNGVRVLFVESHETPLLTLAVVSDRGADQAEPGIADYWTRVALRASEKYAWWDTAEIWNDLGAEYDADALPDASILSVKVMSKLSEDAVLLLGDLMAHPVFPNRSKELAAQRMHADLQVSYARPTGQLDLAVRRHLYPAGHPYREPFPPPGNIDRVTDELLHAYHSSAFTPAHVTVVGAGDLTADAFFALCDRAFAELKGPTVPAQAPPRDPADPPSDPRFVLVDKSSATQAQVSFAWVGPNRLVDDYTAYRLASDSFEERLHERARTEKGLTYGVHTRLSGGRGRVPHEVRTAVEVANVGEVVADAFAILEERAKTPPTDADLKQVKASAGTAASFFEDNDSATSALSTLAIYGYPLDWWSKRAERIAAVDSEAVRLAFERYLSVKQLRVFVVGDASKIRPQLEKLSRGRVDVVPAIPAPPFPKKK